MFVASGDGLTHVGIGNDIFHLVVVKNGKFTTGESLGDRHRHFRLGLHQIGFHLADLCLHFLLGGDCHGTAFFGFGLGNIFIGIGLSHLQFGTDIFADITGDKGFIELPFVTFGDRVRLYDENRNLVEEVVEPWENGFVYEICEVMRCVREGRLYSEAMPPEATIECARIYDKILG